MRPICDFHKARLEATKHLAAVHFNSLDCPTRYHLHPIDSIGDLTHRGELTFHEARFKAVFNEAQTAPSDLADENGIQTQLKLALGGIFCGSYRIHFLGRFLVTHNERERTTTVRKLNGYVKVENRLEMDAHTVSIIRDCVAPTTATPAAFDQLRCNGISVLGTLNRDSVPAVQLEELRIGTAPSTILKRLPLQAPNQRSDSTGLHRLVPVFHTQFNDCRVFYSFWRDGISFSPNSFSPNGRAQRRNTQNKRRVSEGLGE
ncbi:hypothetical protein NMY22_g14909 [Coprinellus aureogranulatus]|nr:hypothetical protein NMY22_g14909 [Coprinellus aureogranulatus]